MLIKLVISPIADSTARGSNTATESITIVRISIMVITIIM